MLHAPLRLLVATSVCALAQPAAAQDFNYNWHIQNNALGGLVFLDGPSLFGAISGDGHSAGPGDAIRLCYGIDTTQGGRNENGLASISWFQLNGAFAASAPGLEFGLVSFQTASVDSLDGDACFSPFFAQGNDSVTGAPIELRTNTALSFVPGIVTVPTPFPMIWMVYFQFLGTSGLQLPNVLGSEPAGVGSFVDPLLSNLIFEIQGPVNGAASFQYFLATTNEGIGLGSGGTGTGGVTNGNGRQGYALSGVTADLSGAVAHHRLTSVDPVSGALTGVFSIDLNGPGSTQFFGESQRGLRRCGPPTTAALAPAAPTSASATRFRPCSGA